MKELIKRLETFVNRRGLDISNVFDDFLQYVIGAHTLPEYAKPIEGWVKKYSKEDTKEFWEMYKVLILAMNAELKHKEWFDPFGVIYEDLIAGKFRRGNKGQFFTPPNLCDLMTEMTLGDDRYVGKKVNDCACGSGRTLLSFQSKNPGNYLIGEDIDRTCCLMTVCNFILHGVVGEVIWRNTLTTETFGAWRTNEQLNIPLAKYRGIPHVREIPTTEAYSIQPTKEEPIKETVRISHKLREQRSKLITEFSLLRKQKLSESERNERSNEIKHKINNVTKLLKKYELLDKSK